MKRIGIFGGSFDPVHYGHLLFAEQAREAFDLDQVIFVPSGCSPHKPDGSYASGTDRAHMLELAIRETMRDMNPLPYSVSRMELHSQGIHYTVDTLEELRRDNPGDRLFLLLGSDVLAGLHHWYRIRKICRLASVITVHRSGAPLPDFSLLASEISSEQLSRMKRQIVSMPLVSISSGMIRTNLAAGKSIRCQTPAAVQRYIKSHQLYQGRD